MSRSLAAKAGSLDSLKAFKRWGCRPWACQIRCTEAREIPTALAMARTVQWVASPGGGAPVRLSTWSTVAAGNGAMPGGRDFSRNSPAIPSVMNRSCQRQTVGLATPACRAIAIVPTPSPLKRMIRARQTCFCGLPGAATIASRRARSPALTSISTSDLILRSLHESQPKGISR